jgi:hypothetical protein
VKVAFKVLEIDAMVDEPERAARFERFMREARALARLKHAHVVSALDLGTFAIEPGAPETA